MSLLLICLCKAFSLDGSVARFIMCCRIKACTNFGLPRLHTSTMTQAECIVTCCRLM